MYICSPVCGKKGNKRCAKLKHIIECGKHEGRYYSRYHGCVACSAAATREEKAAKEAKTDDKEYARCTTAETRKPQGNEAQGNGKDKKQKHRESRRRHRGRTGCDEVGKTGCDEVVGGTCRNEDDGVAKGKSIVMAVAHKKTKLWAKRVGYHKCIGTS